LVSFALFEFFFEKIWAAENFVRSDGFLFFVQNLCGVMVFYSAPELSALVEITFELVE